MASCSLARDWRSPTLSETIAAGPPTGPPAARPVRPERRSDRPRAEVLPGGAFRRCGSRQRLLEQIEEAGAELSISEQRVLRRRAAAPALRLADRRRRRPDRRRGRARARLGAAGGPAVRPSGSIAPASPIDAARERFDDLLERADLRARAAGRQRRRARRLCDDRPRDRRPLRHADRGLGRPAAARPRRHGRGRRSWRSPAAPRSSMCRSTRTATPRVLWSAFDPTVLTVADDPTVERPLDRAACRRVAEGLLMPPPDEQEQDFLERSSASGCAGIRARIEYPLLLAAAGVRRVRRQRLHRQALRGQIRDEWRRYRAGLRRRPRFRRADRPARAMPIAGPTGSRPISRRPTAAATSSTSCSAASPCAWASAPSWRRT